MCMTIPGQGIGACAEVAPERWDAELRAAGVTDVYYARGFVAASAALAGAEPLLLRHGGVYFACLLRSDPVDVVTPYCYGGPAGGPLLGEFPAAYEAWCARRGVVSSFAVFHPLLDNGCAPFRRTPLAGTVAWDLRGDADLVAGMHKHHRRLVRRARAASYDVAVTPRPEDLSGFAPLYERTMRRADAAEFYLFPHCYWEALARDVALVRVDVRAGGETIAAVLGMGEPPWLHYHLGAAADAARGTGASHLALLALAEWGRATGYETLHLGGGVGGRADSLLEYKLRFAPGGLVASEIGKAVHDEAAYLRLSGADEIDWDGFFPAYREGR
jgi:serine/alanine adding enzyme